MKHQTWSAVTREDGLKAIEIFDTYYPEYPELKNTFLIYKGKFYPAKHIRGMAYKVHFGEEISKDRYTGGNQTAAFFYKLGFEVEYNPRETTIHKDYRYL